MNWLNKTSRHFTHRAHLFESAKTAAALQWWNRSESHNLSINFALIDHSLHCAYSKIVNRPFKWTAWVQSNKQTVMHGHFYRILRCLLFVKCTRILISHSRTSGVCVLFVWPIKGSMGTCRLLRVLMDPSCYLPHYSGEGRGLFALEGCFHRNQSWQNYTGFSTKICVGRSRPHERHFVFLFTTEVKDDFVLVVRQVGDTLWFREGWYGTSVNI